MKKNLILPKAATEELPRKYFTKELHPMAAPYNLLNT